MRVVDLFIDLFKSMPEHDQYDIVLFFLRNYRDNVTEEFYYELFKDVDNEDLTYAILLRKYGIPYGIGGRLIDRLKAERNN